MSTTKKVAFHTLGCKLNYAETSSLQQDFLKRGFDVVALGEPADLVVINTCTVTENADTECRKIVRRALRGAPEAAVAVTGCYAQLQPEEIASIDGVRAVFGTAEKSTIAQRAEEILDLDAPHLFVDELDADTTFVGSRTTESDSRTRAFLKLQDGCDYSCTFCTIPLARGPARAMDFAGIKPAIESVEQDGFHEVVLSGINLGEYQASTGERFIDVIKTIDDLQPNLRVRISSIEPNTIKQEHIDVLSTSSVFVPHLHIPLQSGSAEVLKHMKRRYNPAQYRATIEALHERMPDMGLGIDVIVGFPGETDELFEESFEFIKSLPFTYLHVFTYSERRNTPAASMGDRVPMNVRRERTARLRALSEEHRQLHHERNVGTERVIIPETFNRERGTWSGYTENYVKVAYKAPELIINGPHRVRLTEVDGDVVIAEPIVEEN